MSKRQAIQKEQTPSSEVAVESKKLDELRNLLENLVELVEHTRKDLEFSSFHSPVRTYLIVKSRWNPGVSHNPNEETKERLNRCRLSISCFREFWKVELNEMFREWLQQNKLPMNFYIGDYSDDYEPFQYAVYMNNDKVENKKIIRFHLCNGTYRIEKPELTKDEVLERGQKVEKDLREDKARAEKIRKDLQDIVDKPYLYMFKSITSFIQIFFRHERTMNMYKAGIVIIDAIIEALKKEIEKNREETKMKVLEIEEIERGIKMIEPLFQEIEKRGNIDSCEIPEEKETEPELVTT